MKKFLTFALVCCLVFSSSSTVFATATQWDTSDQANLRYIYQSVTSGGSLYTVVNNIYTRVNTISNTLTDIKGYLFQNSHSIAYWVESINSWMQPIYSKLSDILTASLNIDSVAGLLGSTDIVDGTTVRTPYLAYGGKGIAELFNEANNNFYSKIYGLNRLSISNQSASYAYQNVTGAGNLFASFVNDLAKFNTFLYNNLLSSVRTTQTYTNWDDLSSSTFTDDSLGDGLFKWLSKIQTPVARLSYVLASDERIEAQEAAAANEEAVVDNFIDSSGSGSTSASDIGSVSNLSSGFKNNISTDASISGIWNIFNSDNFGWFSQETADQLDTTGSGTRTLKSSGSYPTPLLDQQTEDIMNILGGGDND